MPYKKKRKAVRTTDISPETQAEMDMPVMKTAELAAKHEEAVKKGKFVTKLSLTERGSNKEGKELFEDIFKAMASPDSLSD